MRKLAFAYWFLYILCCFIPHALHAQEDCSIQNFNTSNGLQQNTITGMAFDDIGYLWLGTQNGLIRYDGSSFRTFFFDAQNIGANAANNVLNLTTIPSEKKLLIRTHDGLVYTIANGRPVLYSDSIKKVIYYYNLQGYYPNSFLFNKFNLSIPVLTLYQGWNLNLQAILPVSKTDFIVLSKADSIFFYYKNGIKQKTISITSHWKRFLKSGNYCFVLDDESKLLLFDTSSCTFRQVRVDRDIKKDKEKNVSEGAFYWDETNSQSYYLSSAIFYLLSYNAASNQVSFVPRFNMKEESHFWTNIIYDSLSSTYFLSTLTEGFFQVKLKHIQTFNIAKNISKEHDAMMVINYSLLKSSDSTVLTTTGFEFASNGNATVVKKKGIFYSNRETMNVLGDTAIICAHDKQLFYYLRADNFNSQYVFNDSFNRTNNAYITMLYPEGDSLWVATNKAFFCVTRKKITVLLTKKEGVENVFFGAHLFYRFTKEEVLISNNFGLFKIKTSAPYGIDSFPDMKGKQVRFVSRYKDVFLLSAYKIGLYVFMNNKFYKVPLSTDQSEISYCHSTYIDTNENVWVVTDKGLFKSTISSIIESVSKNNVQPFFFSYGKSDGIANTEFNGSGTPSYAVLKSGQIFYPSMGGIVTFKPENLNEKISAAAIPIEKISIDEKEVSQIISDSISLSSDYSILFIDLSVPYFGEAKNLMIEYSLDGSAWKKLSSPALQRITLLGLSSGYHRVQMRKLVGFKTGDYVYRNMIVYRKKHFYEQWWFFALVTIAFVLFVLMILKWQTRRINNQKLLLQKRVDEQTAELSKSIEVKELLINIISHDMITPLRHISFVAGVLAKGLEKDPEKVTEVLNDVKSTSDRIMTGSLGIINWMKYNNKSVSVNKKQINLYSIINEVCEIFIPIAKEKNISITNNVTKSKFAEIDYHIFSTILNNLISNAIKYSNYGSINIFLDDEDSEAKTTLKISDTGNGMTEGTLHAMNEILKGNIHAVTTTNKLSTGLGYIMIAELIKIHGLSLSVESKLRVGTTVSIEID